MTVVLFVGLDSTIGRSSEGGGEVDWNFNEDQDIEMLVLRRQKAFVGPREHVRSCVGFRLVCRAAFSGHVLPLPNQF